MVVLGLTGGFASGKTTVAKMFKEHGTRLVNSDAIVHRLLSRRTACSRQIVRVFGQGILNRGRIDRRKLGALVFQDPVQRRTLERIVHPQVIQEIRRQVAIYKRNKKNDLILVEVPLLFEAGLEKIFDYTITVFTNRQQQIERALQTRPLTRQEIISRIQAQLPLSSKRHMADILIDNRGSFLYTKRQVNKIWCSLIKKIKEHK